MTVNRYHKLLRVSAIVILAVLIFDGGFFSPITKQLSDNTINYLASVHSGSGVTISVAPTELNQITAELTQRERELDEREAALAGREIENRDFSSPVDKPDYSIYILSTILFILTVLIVLNYALDWARVRRMNYEEKLS